MDRVGNARRHAGSRLFALATAGLLALASCSHDGLGNAGTLDVNLKDFELTLSAPSVPAGTITLVAANAGPSVHEFEIFLVGEGVDPAALPVDSGVAITDGLAPVEEVEDIAPGTSQKLALDLAPGTYAVICNLPEHYANGMHATFTVG